MGAAQGDGKLEALYARICADPGYRGGNMSDIFVPGRGAAGPGGIVMVGEAPGRVEEQTGMPFMGAAGRNLDLLFREAGLSREEIFITNVVKYRPFGPTGRNRNPTLRESRRAVPFLIEELEILAPRLVVCLGLCPARVLVDAGLVMSEASGGIFQRFGLDILVTYHPSPFNFMIEAKRREMVRVFRRLGEIAFGTG